MQHKLQRLRVKGLPSNCKPSMEKKKKKKIKYNLASSLHGNVFVFYLGRPLKISLRNKHKIELDRVHCFD